MGRGVPASVGARSFAIAGVVGDVRHAGLREAVKPMAFYALGVVGLYGVISVVVSARMKSAFAWPSARPRYQPSRAIR